MIKKLILTITLMSGSLALANAQLVWNFTDGDATFDTGTATNFTVSDITTNAASLGFTTSTVSDYTGASGGTNSRISVPSSAVDFASAKYLEFTLTPVAGFLMRLSDLDFGARSSGTGPQVYSLRSSADGYGADIFTGAIANDTSWSLKDNTFSAVNGADNTAVTYRLNLYGGTGGSSNFKIDDINVTAAAVAVPEPSTYMMIVLGMLALFFVARRRLAFNS